MFYPAYYPAMGWYPPVRPAFPPGLRLAEAYVIPQVYTTSYDLKQALHRGTLFPELDHPYIEEKIRGVKGW